MLKKDTIYYLYWVKIYYFCRHIISIYLHKFLCNEKIYQIHGNCHAFGRNHRPK